MEENVALDSSKQKQFVKSIKGIKKLIKKNDAKGVSEKISKAKGKDGKIQKKKRAPRGLVYLGHIPHGFYENEMTQYFKQFGMVTNARVIRSKRTGNSKGFAFVEFKEPAVAEIVAETMNNYLMGKRLIKAAYIPPENQRRNAKRKFWSTTFNPGSEGRLKMKKAYNANKDEQGDLQKARKLLSNINKTKKKLSDLGINYDFFLPVDVPESLVNRVSPADVKKEVNAKENKTATANTKSNKEKKVKEEKTKVENVSKLQVTKKEKTKQTNKKDEVKKEIAQKKSTVESKKPKQLKQEEPVNKKQQAQKEKKLKDAGVKPVENFIKIQQDEDDDSDSSYNFDSDEFENMLNDEDGSDLSNDNEDSGSDEESDEGNDSEEESDGENPPMLVRAPPPKVVQTKADKKGKKPSIPVIAKKEEKAPIVKRGAVQKPVIAPKKSKFENRNTQKLAKKQFKKKK